MKKFLPLLILIVICSICIFAQDVTVPVTTPAEQQSTVIIILHHLTEIISTGFLLLFGWFFKWLIGKAGANDARIHAIEALKAGVESAYQELATEFKNKSTDGILTTDEKKQLREHAIKKALEVAKGPGKDLLLNWGKEIISAKIREIVDARNKAGAKIVVPEVIGTAPEVK